MVLILNAVPVYPRRNWFTIIVWHFSNRKKSNQTPNSRSDFKYDVGGIVVVNTVVEYFCCAKSFIMTLSVARNIMGGVELVPFACCWCVSMAHFTILSNASSKSPTTRMSLLVTPKATPSPVRKWIPMECIGLRLYFSISDKSRFDGWNKIGNQHGLYSSLFHWWPAKKWANWIPWFPHLLESVVRLDTS